MVRHPYSTTMNKTGLMFNISFLFVSVVDMVARRGQHVTMKEIFPNSIAVNDGDVFEVD